MDGNNFCLAIKKPFAYEVKLAERTNVRCKHGSRLGLGSPFLNDG